MSTFLDYYRCPADEASIGTQPQLSPREGYFKFGDAVAFGRFAGGAEWSIGRVDLYGEIEARVGDMEGVGGRIGARIRF